MLEVKKEIVMGKDFSKKLTQQIGESLTVAELGRQGFIATAFTGNVPVIDVLAYKDGKKPLALQVKSSHSSAVFIDPRQFIDISTKNGIQSVKGYAKNVDKDVIYVFVKIADELNDTKFYVLRQQDMAKIVYEKRSAFFKKHKGVPPKKPTYFHMSVSEKDLKKYRDNWKCLK